MSPFRWLMSGSRAARAALRTGGFCARPKRSSDDPDAALTGLRRRWPNNPLGDPDDHRGHCRHPFLLDAEPPFDRVEPPIVWVAEVSRTLPRVGLLSTQKAKGGAIM